MKTTGSNNYYSSYYYCLFSSELWLFECEHKSQREQVITKDQEIPQRHSPGTQKSSTLLTILAVPNSVVFCSSPILTLIPSSLIHCPSNTLKGPYNNRHHQSAKKVVSDSPGLVDFAFALVNSVLNLSDGEVNFFGKFKLQKDGNQSCQSKRVWGIVEMTCGLIHASYILHEWQAVKLNFFSP